MTAVFPFRKHKTHLRVELFWSLGFLRHPNLQPGSHAPAWERAYRIHCVWFSLHKKWRLYAFICVHLFRTSCASPFGPSIRSFKVLLHFSAFSF